MPEISVRGLSKAFGGAVPAVLLGLALIAPITSTLVIVSARLRIPFFGIAALLLVLAPGLWSDNHDLRTCRSVAAIPSAAVSRQFQSPQFWILSSSRKFLRLN